MEEWEFFPWPPATRGGERLRSPLGDPLALPRDVEEKVTVAGFWVKVDGKKRSQLAIQAGRMTPCTCVRNDMVSIVPQGGAGFFNPSTVLPREPGH